MRTKKVKINCDGFRKNDACWYSRRPWWLYLKLQVIDYLQKAGHEVVDFGAHKLDLEDDYPDFIVPMANTVSEGEINRGLAICGSGVGACVVANKVQGIRLL